MQLFSNCATGLPCCALVSLTKKKSDKWSCVNNQCLYSAMCWKAESTLWGKEAFVTFPGGGGKTKKEICVSGWMKHWFVLGQGGGYPFYYNLAFFLKQKILVMEKSKGWFKKRKSLKICFTFSNLFSLVERIYKFVSHVLVPLCMSVNKICTRTTSPCLLRMFSPRLSGYSVLAEVI